MRVANEINSLDFNLILEKPWPVSLSRISFAPPHVGPTGDVLLIVFLRGAADGLNIVIPHGDESYYDARPTIAIPRPDDRSVDPSSRVINLDGFFGLHPSFKPLMEAWDAGHLAIVHACGSPEDSHSHFRAMEYMERGVVTDVGPASGWLNRHLALLDTQNPSPLRGLGWGEAVPRSLQGSVPVTALASISEAHLGGRMEAVNLFRKSLELLYRSNTDMSELGEETLQVLSALQAIDPNKYKPEGKRSYPETEFAQWLKQIAMLIKADIGLEVAAIDLGGWDTHFAQGAAEGHMAALLADLGGGLAAFYADLEKTIDKVTAVVMTEFGRRVVENASLGTDHGHGGVMVLLGGGVAGGLVHTQWPGLERGQLFGPGDLQVTTDYRDVLSEILRLRVGNLDTDKVFPGFKPASGGFVIPRGDNT
ncbi:MAG: DUF1501 domain-containing protein [Anaerolineales bacterium]|jgi:uncharacterized protein (DUF1501 family)